MNRKWDSFIESPPLKRIEFASIASPSPMKTVSQAKGQRPQANGIRIEMVTPYLQEIFALRNNTGNSSPTQVVSRTRDTNQERVHCFPFASRSLEAPGR